MWGAEMIFMQTYISCLSKAVTVPRYNGKKGVKINKNTLFAFALLL